MKISIFILLIVTFHQESLFSADLNKDISKGQVDSYKVGAEAYRRESYDKSLKYYQDFLNRCKKKKCLTTEKLFAIDMIGSIYIRVQKDPSALITYYSHYGEKGKFNDAIQDEIDEWINASREWLKSKKKSPKISKPEELLKFGNVFYQRGIKKKKYPMDRSGNADLSIAASYYVPYIFEFNNSKKVDEALLRMGIIRSTLWTDKEYWSANFYLKEAIRRFPNSTVAKKAFKTLDIEVHYSYTGSAGDFTPPSQIEMLKYFKNISNGKFEKAKLRRKSLF